MKMSINHHAQSVNTGDEVDCIALKEISRNISVAEAMKKPIEAFTELTPNAGNKNCRNGHIAKKSKENSTQVQDLQKKVHFHDDRSPVYELKPYGLHSELLNQDNNIYLLIAIFSLVVATAAVVGCILLYFMATTLQGDVKLLEGRIFGSKGSENGPIMNGVHVNGVGVLDYITNKTTSLRNEVDQLTKWANDSGCIRGHDFTSGQYCYRLLRFELDFWQAYRFCQERDGYLAFADDLASWNKTVFFLLERGFRMKEVWTGVHKDSQGVWRYTDGREATFSRWARGNIFDEGDDCSQIRLDPIYRRIGMYDRRCTINPRPFLCRFRIR